MPMGAPPIDLARPAATCGVLAQGQRGPPLYLICNKIADMKHMTQRHSVSAVNSYQGFPVYVISLTRRRDRRTHMEQLLAERGLSGEFIDAVDGLSLTSAELSRYDRSKALAVYGAEMSPGEIGCCLSHLKVYETMLARGDELALVLEDDIECDVDFAETLRAVVDHSREPWLVLRLQSTKGSIIAGDCAATAGDRVERVRGRSVARLRSGVLGGCGYLIRREGAARLLRYGRRPFMPADQLIDRYWENGIDPYVLRPFPVRQSPRIDSEIAARKVTRASGRLQTTARRARRAWDGLAKRGYGVARLGGWRPLVGGAGVAGAALGIGWAADIVDALVAH